MHHTLSKPTRIELLDALRQRYQQAPKSEKTKVLDEFVAVAGCHRKHAIRLLAATRPAAAATPAVARRTYDEAIRQALIVLWEAADRICGKRLKAVLPEQKDVGDLLRRIQTLATQSRVSELRVKASSVLRTLQGG